MTATLRPYEPFTPAPGAGLDRDSDAVWPSVVWALLDGTGNISDDDWPGSWTEAVTYREYRRRVVRCSRVDPEPTLEIGPVVVGRAVPIPKLSAPWPDVFWDGDCRRLVWTSGVVLARAARFESRAAALAALLRATLPDVWRPIDFDHLDVTFLVAVTR